MRLLVLSGEESGNDALLAALRQEQFLVDVRQIRSHSFHSYHAGRFDCVILNDCVMEEARELAREIRSASYSVGLLILGAEYPPEIRAALYESGADECLAAPFCAAELVAKLHALSRRQQQGGVQLKLRIADLEIDCVHHTVQRAGRALQLTNREFLLLEYLARNADRPVTRSMIMERVWNQEYEGLTNVVDVFINLLRRKVDKDFEPKLVHTARGVGYLIKSPISTPNFPPRPPNLQPQPRV